MPNNVNETLSALKDAQQNPQDLNKSFTQSASPTTGLTYYDLQAPALTLVPVLTPLRNMIPRVVGGAGTQANWVSITGVNTTNVGLGLGEGKRGHEIQQSTKENNASYKFLGTNNSVTFEAEFAAGGFADLKALAVKQTLQAVMIQEEFLDYGGNNSLPLGTTPTPVLTSSTSGGTISGMLSVNVYCIALSQKGYQQVVGFNNGTTGQKLNLPTAVLKSSFTFTDVGDGVPTIVPGGLAIKSSVANVTTGVGGTNSIAAAVTPVRGAFAYAWFWGAAGSELLGAITALNSVSITATATGTQNIASSFIENVDYSFDTKIYDGLLTQILKADSGSYVKFLDTGVAGVGTKLTSNGAGGVNEIDDALAAFYNSSRLSPQIMIVSANVKTAISKIVIANGGAPLIRFSGDFNNSSNLSAGTSVGEYLNQTTGDLIKIMVHPNAAPGTIMFYSDTIPYSLSGVTSVLQKKLRRDYYQIDWPLRTRKNEYGVYFDGVLQNYFTPAFGLIANIAA